MSLRVLKEITDIEVGVEFYNSWTGRNWEDIYADDNKIGEDGKIYKFSIFDQECNMFRFPDNKFTGRINPCCHSYRQLLRTKVFSHSDKIKGARVKIVGSYKPLSKEE